MPTDPARAERIQGDVEWLRGQKINLDGDVQAWPFTTNAEWIAFVAESCRSEGHDESEVIEVLLTMAELPREDLTAAAKVLEPLGYAKITPVLREMALKAKRRPRPSRQTASAKAYNARMRAKRRAAVGIDVGNNGASPRNPH